MTDSPRSVPDPDDSPGETTVTVYEDGPLIVRGPFVLQEMGGIPIEPGRRSVALCRCGYSAIKPFCDGSHRRAGFAASGGDERPRPMVSGDDAHRREGPATEQLAPCRPVERQAARGTPEDR